MFSNIDRPLFANFPWLFLPMFSKHLRNSSETSTDLRPGQWNMDCGEKYMKARGGLRCPWAIQVDVRTMKPPRIWAMETRNGFVLENSPELAMEALVPHFSCHSPATYLTHKLTSFKARDWHGFVSKFGHHSSLSGWNIEEFLHLIGPCPSHYYIAMKNHHL